jgi:hypothetical protein
MRLGDPFTRWTHREAGQRLVAIAAKDDDGVISVLPIQEGWFTHPLDWMPEASFLRAFEREIEPIPDPPFDPDELVHWAEMYGHPEEWVQLAQAAHARAEKLERAIQTLESATKGE